MKIDFAFVILTYRSFEDVEQLISSIREKFNNYISKILVVNSFYDDESENIIRNISEKLGCDFLNTQNLGYGHGNNVGINYFNENYEYSFLVIANPDTLVINNELDYIKFLGKPCLIAPEIKNLNGKRQNPYWVIKNSFSEKMVYKYYKNGHKILLYIGLGINKLIRVFFNIIKNRNKKRIYAAHGSFLIFSKELIDILKLPYDENMFLFAEENLLAHNLERLKVPTYYTSKIKILHKEDGSMNVAKINENAELKKSIIYYYEKVNKKC